MCNKEIKDTIKENGLKFWQVADALGISASTFTVWMRHELTADKKGSVLKAIEIAKKERKSLHE